MAVPTREAMGVTLVFFFQAEDGIRDLTVTGVQTCALPISRRRGSRARTGAARAGAPRDDRRPSRCGLRARDRRRTPVVRGRPGGQGAPGGPSTPPPIAVTQSQRPPPAATTPAPRSPRTPRA